LLHEVANSTAFALRFDEMHRDETECPVHATHDASQWCLYLVELDFVEL
jgi:hypothetical protein